MSLIDHIGQMLLATIVASGPVPLAVRLARGGRGQQRRSTSERALVVAVTWCALQAGLGLALGMTGALRLLPLLAAEVLLLAGGVLALRSGGFSPREGVDVGAPPRRSSRSQALLLGGLGWVGVVMAWRVIARPTGNFDSLYYHLPHVAWWIQHGDLRLHEAFYPVHRYPFTWEVLSSLLVIPLHEDLLVSTPNLVAWLVLGLAIVRVGRLLGADRTPALLAAAAVLVMPEVLGRLDAVQVDLALAAFFMAALAFGLSLLRRRSPRSLFLGLVCLGMMAGVKLTGLLYGVLLLVVLAGLRVLDRISRGSAAPAAAPPGARWWRRALVSGLAAAALVAGFWYARNLAQVGNPLGYFEVRLGPWVVFPGPLQSTHLLSGSLASLATNDRGLSWSFYLRLLGQRFGIAFYVLLLSALLWPLMPRREGRRELLVRLWLLLALLGGSFFVYWTSPATAGIGRHVAGVTPWTANSLRFAFPFVASLAAVAAAAWSGARWPARILVPLFPLAAVLAVVRLADPTTLIVAAAGIAAAIALTWRGRARAWLGFSKVRLGLAGAVLLASVLLLSWKARATRDVLRPEVYGDGYRFLCEHIDPHETVGWISSTRSYIFYGKNLDRRVEYVARRSDDLGSWLDLLRRRHVDVVALGPFTRRGEGWKGMRERRWMALETTRFVKLAGSGFPAGVFYYRFVDEAPAGADSTGTARARRSRPRPPR